MAAPLPVCQPVRSECWLWYLCSVLFRHVHPHRPPTPKSITNGTHCRVAQRVLASQSLVDALQLLPHRACTPAPCTLHLSLSLSTEVPQSLSLSLPPQRLLHAVPCPLVGPCCCSRARPISSSPCSHHPSSTSIHQPPFHQPSTIPSAVSLVPASFSTCWCLFCRRWILTCLGLWTDCRWTGLDWTGLDRSRQISQHPLGCLSSRTTFLSTPTIAHTRTHNSHPPTHPSLD